jgi:glutathione-specific gamma-glutamylcyclotransferase
MDPSKAEGTHLKTPASTGGITRASLADGSFIAHIRAVVPKMAPGTVVRTDEELATAQADFLKDRPLDHPLWVFGYGSLMWNPAINFVERRVGTLQGWSRRLNLWMIGGRGTREHPALTLGLQRGGHAHGVIMRLDSETGRHELSLLWRREAFTSAYLPCWVQVETDGGAIEAITFVSNENHANYAGGLSDAAIADVVASASGTGGTCADYLEQTLASIEALDLQDAHLSHIRALVSRR